MTILLASTDDNLIASARKAFATAGSTCVVARSGLECLDAMHREVPDLVILDQFLPWGGADGVLAILEDCGEAWIGEVPILVLTSEALSPTTPRLRTYPFLRSCCERKLPELVEMFQADCLPDLQELIGVQRGLRALEAAAGAR